MQPQKIMNACRDAAGASKTYHHREVSEEEFVRLWIAADYREGDARMQARVSRILGSEVWVGKEWLSVKGER